MFHFSGRIALGMDVRNLLQLQRAFQRDRIVDAPPKIEEVALHVIALRHRDNFRFAAENPLDQGGQRDKPIQPGFAFCGRHRATDAAKMQRQQIQRGELRRERLRGRDPDLRARAGIQDTIRFTGQGTAHHVADGDHPRALAFRFARRRECVGGFP